MMTAMTTIVTSSWAMLSTVSDDGRPSKASWVMNLAAVNPAHRITAVSERRHHVTAAVEVPRDRRGAREHPRREEAHRARSRPAASRRSLPGDPCRRSRASPTPASNTPRAYQIAPTAMLDAVASSTAQ